MFCSMIRRSPGPEATTGDTPSKDGQLRSGWRRPTDDTALPARTSAHQRLANNAPVPPKRRKTRHICSFMLASLRVTGSGMLLANISP